MNIKITISENDFNIVEVEANSLDEAFKKAKFKYQFYKIRELFEKAIIYIGG